MNRNFTRLVCAGIASFCMMSAMGQEKATTVRITDKVFLESRAELRADNRNQLTVGLRSAVKAQPDSTITYAATGEKTEKIIYTYDAQGRVSVEEILSWKDGNWINETRYAYKYEDGKQRLESKWESGKWIEQGGYSDMIDFTAFSVSYTKNDFLYSTPYPFIGYVGFGFSGGSGRDYKAVPTHDEKGNLTAVEYQVYEIANPSNFYLAYRYAITYNENSQLLSIKGYDGEEIFHTVEYQYSSSGTLVFFEESNYNDNGTLASHTKYTVENNMIIAERENYSGKAKWAIQTGESGNFYMEQEYTFTDNRWYMTHYTIYYPNEVNTPNVETANNTPVGDTNEGGFDLNVNIPADSIASGSVTVTLPEGLTLDETNTALAVDVAGLFDLTITKQENNTWLIGIKLKPSSKSGALRADEAAGAMLHVAYKVEDTLPRGTYNISVNSILFETPFGNMIPEPAITVPANINRWAVANERISDQEITAYIADHTLYIGTNQPDEVSIYTVNGVKVYEATIQPGTTAISTASLPQGMLIMQGKSGWVRKVMN